MSTTPLPPKPAGSGVLRVLRWVLVILVVFVLVVVAVGLFVLDGRYDLSREITIKAPPEAIHRQVGDLDQWPNWLPFTKHDPSVKTIVEKPTGVGAHQHWTSDNGNGKLTFTTSDEQKGIEYDMVFDEKWKAQGAITYIKVGDDTRVIWRMTGQNEDFMGKWFAVAMRPMMGPKLEEGLSDLKAKVEGK